jgi:hypothetical protein
MTWKLAEERNAQMEKHQEFILDLSKVQGYILAQTDTSFNSVYKPKIEFERIRTLRQKHYEEYRLMVYNSERIAGDYYFITARMGSFLVEVDGYKVFC